MHLHDDLEVRRVEELAPLSARREVRAANRRLREVALRYLRSRYERLQLLRTVTDDYER